MYPFPKGTGKPTGMAPPRRAYVCMEALSQLFQVPRAIRAESEPRSTSQRIAYRGEAEVATQLSSRRSVTMPDQV
jgi:hypothetical protein